MAESSASVVGLTALLAFLGAAAGAWLGVKIFVGGSSGEATAHIVEIDVVDDAESGKPRVSVTPEKLVVMPGDAVFFLNLNEEGVATVDFSESESTKTPFVSLQKFTLQSGGSEGCSSADTIDPAAEPGDYPYTVLVGGTEQSPVIQIGPKVVVKKE
jgi:hypothetical protein